MHRKAFVRICKESGPKPIYGLHSRRKTAVQKRIPGTLTAYTFLAASSLFVAAACAGALWLTERGAVWLGHALP